MYAISTPLQAPNNSVLQSLAYEIAPFNIKMSIIQPNLEIGVLTNKITSAPALPQYSPENNGAPLCRGLIGGLLDRLESSRAINGAHNGHTPSNFSSDKIERVHPKLPPDMEGSLIAETVKAITAIGGHDNPPARHIVGYEGVASVKEKLKTVSEELEDFVEMSCADDIDGAEGENDSMSEVHDDAL